MKSFIKELNELNPITIGLTLLGLKKEEKEKTVVQQAEIVEEKSPYFEFGPMTLTKNFVFLEKTAVYCIVPPTPIMSGHVIIVPKRRVRKYSELKGAELFDIALSCKYLTEVLQQSAQCMGSTVYIQVRQHRTNDRTIQMKAIKWNL